MESYMHMPALRPRQQPGKGSTTEEFFKLLQDPFGSQLLTKALWTSLITSLGTTLVLALLFSILRPHYTTVYAPRLKRAHGGYVPPPVGKGLLAWTAPVRKTREAQLAQTLGLDAVVFLRFSRMCRNMFLVMSLFGLGILIPANVTGSVKNLAKGLKGLMQMSPLVVFGRPLWAQVICAWLFDLVIMAFLYRNYVVVRRLRRAYFESDAYQSHLHARTLMAIGIPPKLRSDEGVYQICSTIKTTPSVPHTVIGRDVKGLRELIKEHEKTVRKLESYLAKHLKNPDKVPTVRPKCKPMKGDTDYSRDQKVDAIDYLTKRMQRLEDKIKEVRKNSEASAAMSYGFSCYDTVEEAHAVAYGARRKQPNGAVVKLAPPPNHILWDNLPLSKSARRWKRFVNTLWVALLTVIWIAPNAMIAIFLANLPNLGKVWPAFQRQLYASPGVWAAVQGIASPAILSLFYVLLPILFRRLANRAGDTTKTSRERHVLHQLYAFFIFNNLVVFTTFSAIWQFITAVIKAKNDDGRNILDAIKAGDLWTKLLAALCTVSPFWVTWLLQRNLGAAVDLAQVANLFWIWFTKTFLSHTPRQREEWMSPPPFDYASYYNYFLFYATVALCFATLQPIILPVAALYFTVDSWLKKYLLMYVFVTKNESGGLFWRAVYNRMIFAAILANVVVISVVSARKEWNMAITMSPGPLVMILFKLYCRRAFDNDIHYYRKNLTDSEGLPKSTKTTIRQEELERKFDNPVFYHPLMTPMVWKGSEKALASLLPQGRSQSDAGNVTGYDGILLDSMSEREPGKTSQELSNTPFHFVSENLLEDPDAQNESYVFGIDEGAHDDLISERPYTPASHKSGNNAGPYITPPYSRTASPAASVHNLRRNVSYSNNPQYSANNHYYPNPNTTTYHRSQSPLSRTGYPPPGAGYNHNDMMDAAGNMMGGGGGGGRIYSHPHENESQSELLRNAATMPTTATTSYHYPLLRREDSAGSAYTNTSSYDESRRGRR